MDNVTLQDGTQLDGKVVKVMRAIRSIESQGNPNAVGDNGTSTGLYQWNNGKTPVAPGGIPANFQSDARAHGLDPNDFSPANQNKVMYKKTKAQKDAGLLPDEIAALHNGASKDSDGRYTYNNPDYGVKFNTALREQGVNQQAQPVVSQSPPQPTSNPFTAESTIGANPTQPWSFNQAAVDNINQQGIKPLAGIAEGATNLPTSVGGGFQNALRAGGRELGMNTPAVPSNPSVLTGSPVAPIGYNEQGQELGPIRTGVQAAGAGLEALSYAGLPELKYLASVGKVNPVVKQLLSGGFKTGIQGAEFMGGQSLRTNPENTPEAILKAGEGFGYGTLLGTGLAGYGAAMNRLTGASKNVVSRLDSAQGNPEKFQQILNEPETQTAIKSMGIDSPQRLQGLADDAYKQFTGSVEEHYKTNNSMVRKIKDNTSKEDLHTVMEYASDHPFEIKGGKLVTQKTSDAILADQKKVGESMSSILDGMDMAGINTSIPRTTLESDIMRELDRIGSTPQGSSINKATAFKQAMNMMDNQVGKSDMVPMKAQANLKIAANERYPMDAERNTKEAAGEALGNAIRAHHDAIIERGAATGALDSKAVQAYKDLNTVWGKLDRAAEASDIIAKTTTPPKKPRFMPEIIAGLASGGYNPIVYWGTQGSAHAILNAMDRQILLGRYTPSGFKATPSQTKGLLNAVEATKADIASHIENQTAQKMLAEQSIKDAESAISRRGLSATPEVPDNYNLGQDIQMGSTPQSKYKVDTGLPEVTGAPKVYANKNEYESYTPANKLPTINMAAGATGLGSLGELLKGKDTFNRNEDERKNGIYRVNGKKVVEDDLKELGAILYGEMSNGRTPEQYKEEALKIANIAFNRMNNKEWRGKSLKEILQQDKQFQAKGNKPYTEYLNGASATTTDAKTKLKAINDVLDVIRKGDTIASANRDLNYFHDKNNDVRTFSDYKNLIKNISKMK